MCGIVGAVLSGKDAVDEVYCGLKQLEYRGYDSVGMSVLCGGNICTVKHGGRVESIGEEVKKLSGEIAIGHTRWATHGQPTDINAHPHTSGRFSIVHNGIIENYRDLKRELEDNGEKFVSETDSEVIVRLLNMCYSGDILGAIAKTVRKLKGSFALAVLCADFDGIVAVKYKNPIILGFDSQNIYLSSDIPALPQCVESVCVPEDGDIAVITRGNVKFYDFALSVKKRVKSPISLGQFAKGKGDYPHYMIKETCEAARTLCDTVGAFERNVDKKKLKSLVENADKIIITGCGTAYNAGLAVEKEFGKFAFTRAEIASELRYDLPKVTDKTLVLAVTQSGETADTVEAVTALKSAGAKIVTVTNCGYSAITRVADVVVPVCAGAEICVAATKSYIGQLATLTLIASLVNGNSAADDLIAVSEKIADVLADEKTAAAIAGQCAISSAVFFLGRGVDYPVAVEGSLKLKEVSYVFSDAYPAGELKHGTLALVDENTLSVFSICDPELSGKCESAVEQVVSRKGHAAVITTLPQVAERLKDVATVWLLPECQARFSPFLSSVALQLIAYKAAVILNRDPDKPRNLAKSVTVE